MTRTRALLWMAGWSVSCLLITADAFVGPSAIASVTTAPLMATRTISTTQLQATDAISVCKNRILSLVQNAPSGRATPAQMSAQILKNIRALEGKCPTPDDLILSKQSGSWELLWTAQDPQSPETKQNWILNPIENQSYSINPEGRSKPFLPLPLQNFLEKVGWVSATPLRSTQAIDLQQNLIRNIVALTIGGRRASLTVFVKLAPTSSPRVIHVQFERFSINVPDTPIQWELPLGRIGPTGWLKTVYIDDDLRVTRGHKGSVFVLSRPRRGSV